MKLPEMDLRNIVIEQPWLARQRHILVFAGKRMTQESLKSNTAQYGKRLAQEQGRKRVSLEERPNGSTGGWRIRLQRAPAKLILPVGCERCIL
jgi:hypothetical protein